MNTTILKFGKFKGQKFSDVPKWYQDWLRKQDWFDSSEISDSNSNKDLYALVENGEIHSDDLSFDDSQEMLKRHSNCFPESMWEILPMSAVAYMEKAEGILQRHARIAKRYF